jgi:hypothetical protein
MMKRQTHLVPFILLLCAAASLQAQDTPPASTYEEPPTLQARQILRPEFVEGPHFMVQNDVPTYSGANQYTIVSDYGTFMASGNELLVERVTEIGALAKLEKIKESDEFTKALKKAASSPVGFAKNLAKEPVQTVSGVPKGIWRMMNRAGDAIKGAGEKIKNRNEDQPKDPYDAGMIANAAGFPKAKRELATRIGVDPYSSNEVLQRELNRIAWTSVGGASTLNLLMMPIGGGAGTALSATYFVSGLDDDLRNLDPADLQKRNAARLNGLGVGDADAKALLRSTAYSPTRQTALISALSKLGNPENIGSFIQLAIEADSEPDAVFYQRTAEVLAQLAKNGVKIARMGVLNGIPISVTADGTVLVALEWDYAAWTPLGEKFITALMQPPANQPAPSLRIVLTGVASDRTKQELAQRKIELTERALPGPLLDAAH